METRLQKFLAQAGVCSRREGERLILEGHVAVNGVAITTLGAKVDSGTDRVTVDGKPVSGAEPLVYLLLNKPPGYVSSCRHRDEKVVLDLVKTDARIYPVGRLDKESEGLLLLTNDGRVHLKLSHPSFDHEKEYEVRTARPLTDADLSAMAGGMLLDGTRTRHAKVRRMGVKQFSIVLQEGRNRQIRRMLGQLGHEVLQLKRTRMAGLRLKGLLPGAFRHLTAQELKTLLEML